MEEYLNALEKESDRAAAILAATSVEDSLEEAIVAKFPRKLSQTERGELFDGFGPLATFSAKIKMAYALEIVGPQSRTTIQYVVDIRNAFAHALLPITFDTPAVNQACMLLKAQEGWGTGLAGTARSRYIEITGWLAFALMPLGEPSALRDW